MAKHLQHKLIKSLGQHFLEDETVLLKIVNQIKLHVGDLPLLEVGPGAGALTSYFAHEKNYKLIEFDKRWVKHLEQTYPNLKDRIIQDDVLKVDFNTIYPSQMAVIGNFPYNISSQIIFKILDFKSKVPVMVGMFQKEVAERICAKEGSKVYGITSVLTQAFYEVEYLFDVPREAFNPPPKVVSGVMVMKRKEGYTLPCNYKLFKSIVKAGFNQRRKMLRSGLKPFLNDEIRGLEVFSLRPEQLSVDAFINITNIIESNSKND